MKHILNILVILLQYAAIFVLIKKKDGGRFNIKPIRNYLFLWTFVCTLALLLYYVFKIKSNLFLFHIFTPVGYVFLCSFFEGLFEKKRIKNCIRYSAVFFVVISVLLSVFIQPVNMFNSYAVLIESVLVIIWGLLYLHHVFVSEEINQPHTEMVFWFCTGVLVQFIGKLFIQGSMNYLMKYDMKLAAKIYSFEYFFDYLFIISIIIGAFSNVIFKPLKTVPHIY